MKHYITLLFLLVALSSFNVESLLAAQFDVRTAEQLHDALAKAEGNGESDSIHIFEGEYPGNFSYGSTEPYDLWLIGGYSDENDPIHDPSKTVLDGGQKGSVLTIATIGGVVIQHLTIQNGKSKIGGGGILLGQWSKDGSGAIWLWDNIIHSNSTIESGGGIRIDLSAEDGATGTLTLMGNVIYGNRADKQGGGIYLSADNESGDQNPGKIHLIGNEIAGNDSDRSGGGAFIMSKSDTGRSGYIGLSRNTIRDNECHTNWNPNDICNGGGVKIISSSNSSTGISSPIEISQNVITDNTVTGYGGGLEIRARSKSGGAAPINLDENYISNNIGAIGAGGAMVSSFGASAISWAGDVSVRNNTIHGNQAERHYGGICASASSPLGTAGNVVVVNNMITSNRTDGWYGGLCASSYTKEGCGGSVTLTHNTISANEASVAAGGVGAYVMPGETLNMYNNIIWGNTGPYGGDIRLPCSSANTIHNGYNNNYGDMFSAWTSQGNNINQNPQFVGGDDYHLQSGSVCRDAGTAQAPELPDNDYDGNVRIFGNAPDMGADEFIIKFIDKPFFPDLGFNR